MESLAVLTQRDKRKLASISPSVIPGRGQIRFGQHRGWAYLTGVVGATGMTVYSWMQYSDAKDRFEGALTRYNNSGSPADYNDLVEANDDKSGFKNQTVIFGIAAGSIWVWSVADAYIWGGGKTVDFADTGTSSPQLLLVAGPRQVGIVVRF